MKHQFWEKVWESVFNYLGGYLNYLDQNIQNQNGTWVSSIIYFFLKNCLSEEYAGEQYFWKSGVISVALERVAFQFWVIGCRIQQIWTMTEEISISSHQNTIYFCFPYLD